MATPPAAWSACSPKRPRASPCGRAGVSFGSDGQKRRGPRPGGQTAQGLSYVVSASRFMTADGWRDHSAADRNVANAKLSTALGGTMPG